MLFLQMQSQYWKRNEIFPYRLAAILLLQQR